MCCCSRCLCNLLQCAVHMQHKRYASARPDEKLAACRRTWAHAQIRRAKHAWHWRRCRRCLLARAAGLCGGAQLPRLRRTLSRRARRSLLLQTVLRWWCCALLLVTERGKAMVQTACTGVKAQVQSSQFLDVRACTDKRAWCAVSRSRLSSAATGATNHSVRQSARRQAGIQPRR